jgi:hypothetical protein
MSWIPMAAQAGMSIYNALNPPDNTPQKLDTMNSGQKKLLKQMTSMLSNKGSLGQGMQGGIDLQRQLMDPSSQAVEQFAQPYMNQFNQQTIPNLSERFAGMGAMGGGLSSSGFGQSLGAAGGNLQAMLAQLKAGLGQQAAQSLMGHYSNLSNQSLSAQPFAYMRQQEAPGMGGGFMQGFGQGGFPGLGSMFSGGGGGGNSYQGPSYSSIQSNPLVQQAKGITA